MTQPLMLSVAEAARLLGIDESNAYALIRRGEFPVPGAVRKIGRTMKISRPMLEEWARGTETVPFGAMSERRTRYLQIIGEVHTAWALANEPVRFAPDEHPGRSDYNVEVLEIEATAEQLDELNRLTVERLDAEGLLDLHPLALR